MSANGYFTSSPIATTLYSRVPNNPGSYTPQFPSAPSSQPSPNPPHSHSLPPIDRYTSHNASSTTMSYPPTAYSHTPMAHPAQHHHHPPPRRNLSFLDRLMGKGKDVPGVWESVGRVLVSSWLNWLFVFVPLSWVAHFLKWDATLVFFLALFGLVPLEKMMDYLGEELAMYCGHTVGDLIFISLHNAVEGTLALILLQKCYLRIVQSTVIGVVLLHILFVPGVAFMTGGRKVFEQLLLEHPTELNHTLMTVGVLSLLVPAAIWAVLNETPIPDAAFAAEINEYDAGRLLGLRGDATSTATSAVATATKVPELLKRMPKSVLRTEPWTPLTDFTRGSFLALSRGIAIILLLVYIASRIYLHNPPKQDDIEADPSKPKLTRSRSDFDAQVEKEREHEIAHHQHKVNPWVCIFFLVILVGLMAGTSEWMVVAVLEMASQNSVTEEWLGLIVLPIASFLGDALVAIVFYIRTALGLHPAPMDSLAKGRDIDSSIQFMMMWLPLLILISWAMGHPLSMLFDLYEVVVLVGSCFLVNSVTSDHRTNWAEGCMMVSFYLVIALSAWFYHGQASHAHMLTCKTTVIESIAAGSKYGFGHAQGFL